MQPQRQPPGRSGPPAPAKRGINPRPVQNSQGLQLDDVLGGLQGLGSRPARLGHIRQGTQQAGSSRAWLGSQQRDGSQLWASNGSQPDNESQPAVQMQDCTGLGEGSSATVVKQGTAQQSLQTGCGLPMGDLGGSVRQREEHIRLPPISSGRSFRDEYEVGAVHAPPGRCPCVGTGINTDGWVGFLQRTVYQPCDKCFWW